MTVHLRHLDGSFSRDASDAALVNLVAELAQADDEHPDVVVLHESGWALAAFRGGRLVWENVSPTRSPRHMTAVPRDKILQLWAELREGSIESVEAEPWSVGYPSS